MRTLRLTYHIRVIIQTRHGTMAGKTCEKTPAGVWPHSFGILGLNVRRTRCMALEISDMSHFRTLTQTLASIGNAFTVTLLYPGIIDAAERNPYQAGNFNWLSQCPAVRIIRNRALFWITSSHRNNSTLPKRTIQIYLLPPYNVPGIAGCWDFIRASRNAGRRAQQNRKAVGRPTRRS